MGVGFDATVAPAAVVAAARSAVTAAAAVADSATDAVDAAHGIGTTVSIAAATSWLPRLLPLPLLSWLVTLPLPVPLPLLLLQSLPVT